MEISAQIRYRITDVIKVTNSLQDINLSLKSIARSHLVNQFSKVDLGKIEIEKNYIKQQFVVDMNMSVKKWGVEIVETEM